jgi:hypothetical protein
LQIRPEDVLEKALAMVETSQKNYLYKCDQLKSIRQDLTVQRIQNELTIKVFFNCTWHPALYSVLFTREMNTVYFTYYC